MPVLQEIDMNQLQAHDVDCNFLVEENDETFLPQARARQYDSQMEIFRLSRDTEKLSSKTNKQYIKCTDQFRRQCASFFPNLNPEQLLEVLQLSLGPILKMKFDSITLEITSEQSVYYTLKKDEFTFFFQHFLLAESDEDEAMLTYFKYNVNHDSYAGDLESTLRELYNLVMLPRNTVDHVYLDAISY
jgi:hypothetical protein